MKAIWEQNASTPKPSGLPKSFKKVGAQGFFLEPAVNSLASLRRPATLEALMRYLIREKLLSLGDDFRILDDAGRERFHVDGRAFTILREKLVFVLGFAVATVVAFSILLLEPNVVDATRTFWDRTLGWQLGRESPVSI